MPYKTLEKISYASKEEYLKTYEDRYKSKAAIHLDFDIADQKCFFVQCEDVISLMYEILKLDKKVSLLCARLPGIALQQYSRKCLIDEIVLTNNIEGVHSSRKEIGEALEILEFQSDKKGKKNRYLGMVNRYYKFLSNEKVKLDTCQDIRSVYDEIVLEEVLQEDRDNAPDGMLFRKELASVRSAADKELHKGLYPEKKIIEYMEKALHFLHDEEIEPLYRICVFHYLLEYIHPFYDGNGRLGRFILSYCITEHLEKLLAYRISETIKENINIYYRAFSTCNNVRNKGDLTPFLIMLLSMIKESEEELVSSLTRKFVSWGEYEAKIQKFTDAEAEKVKRLYSILVQAALFSELGVSIDGLQENLKQSLGTLRKNLKSIDDKGLLITAKAGRRLYYSLNTGKLDEHLG